MTMCLQIALWPQRVARIGGQYASMREDPVTKASVVIGVNRFSTLRRIGDVLCPITIVGMFMQNVTAVSIRR